MLSYEMTTEVPEDVVELVEKGSAQFVPAFDPLSDSDFARWRDHEARD